MNQLPTITDYANAIKIPQLIKANQLKGGYPVERNRKLIKYSGGFCVVFPYQTSNAKYAVRCWHANVSNAQERTRLISEAIQSSHLPYFVSFDYVSNGIVTPTGTQPIVIMDWVDAKTLKEYLKEYRHDAIILNQLAESFKRMVSELHQHHFSHGDLQHGNIMVRTNGNLVLVDYDSMCVPTLVGQKEEIKGLLGYQHPARWKNNSLTEKADYFSELVIYLSIKAIAKKPELWERLNLEDSETLIFSADDINSKGTTHIFNELKTDNELNPYVTKICEYLQKESIEELLPLEKATVSLTDSITDKWKTGNGYKPKPKQDLTGLADSISNKW